MGEEEDYKEFDRLVKEGSQTPEGDLYCPKCGSPRLYYFLGFKAGQIYVCKDCGYHGALVVEDGNIAEEIRGKWIEEKKGSE